MLASRGLSDKQPESSWHYVIPSTLKEMKGVKSAVEKMASLKSQMEETVETLLNFEL